MRVAGVSRIPTTSRSCSRSASSRPSSLCATANGVSHGCSRSLLAAPGSVSPIRVLRPSVSRLRWSHCYGRAAVPATTQRRASTSLPRASCSPASPQLGSRWATAGTAGRVHRPICNPPIAAGSIVHARASTSSATIRSSAWARGATRSHSRRTAMPRPAAAQRRASRRGRSGRAGGRSNCRNRTTAGAPLLGGLARSRGGLLARGPLLRVRRVSVCVPGRSLSDGGLVRSTRTSETTMTATTVDIETPIERASSLPWEAIVRFAALATLCMSAYVLLHVAQSSANPLDFIQPGAEGPSADVIRADFPGDELPAGLGLDGQQYYAVARDPMHVRDNAAYLDRPRYRMQRPVFPLLAWALHPMGGGTGLVVAFVIVGIAALFVGCSGHRRLEHGAGWAAVGRGVLRRDTRSVLVASRHCGRRARARARVERDRVRGPVTSPARARVRSRGRTHQRSRAAHPHRLVSQQPVEAQRVDGGCRNGRDHRLGRPTAHRVAARRCGRQRVRRALRRSRPRRVPPLARSSRVVGRCNGGDRAGARGVRARPPSAAPSALGHRRPPRRVRIHHEQRRHRPELRRHPLDDGLC